MTRSIIAALFAALLALAGCAAEPADRPPDRPGGGGSSGGNQPGEDPDAGGGNGNGDAVLSGSLCRLTDLRFFDRCTPADLSGVDIGIRGSTATALADASGDFEIADPGGALVLEVGFTSPDIRDLMIEIAAPPIAEDDTPRPAVTVPVVLQTDWDALVDALQIIEPDGTGTLALYARRDGLPVPGVEVIGPSGSLAAFYDAGSALEWSQLGLTGAAGSALVFAVNDTGATDPTLVDPLGPVIDAVVPVGDGTLTVAVIEL